MSSNEENSNTTALNTIIGALTPLTSEDRHRVVAAAMMVLGESPIATVRPKGADPRDGETAHSSTIQRWMEQNSVSAEQLERVFQFGDDGSFDIFDVSGTTKKERMLNTYVLTGLAKYLASGDRNFDETTARKFCEQFGCYDLGNFNVIMKAKGADFSGDKTKGYTLSNVGIKRGATLVKEIAGAVQ